MATLSSKIGISPASRERFGGATKPGTASQRTLRADAEVAGVGFVTGADVTMRLLPAPADAGIVFVRTDLPNRPTIPATIDHVVPERRRRTALRRDGVVVEMTEHVLAALAGLGIDNCVVELDAPETPGMDGSALAFVEAIDRAGIRDLEAQRRFHAVRGSWCVNERDALVALHPGPDDRLDVTFNLDYADVVGIGRQSLMAEVTPKFFRDQLAPARTFVLMSEVEQLRRQGLGSRVSTKDLLVFGADGHPVDNRLRFRDECVRHKILDVIGDFALFGRPLAGHALAHKSGHHLNARLVRRVVAEANS